MNRWMTTSPLNSSRLERFFRQLTLIISNVVKLGGLFLALKAAASPPVDPFELALSAFMMSGAQVSEQAVLRMINSFLGREEAAKPATHREPEEHEEK